MDYIIPAVLSYILQVNIIVAQGRYDTDLQPIIYKIKYACEQYNLEYMQTMLTDYITYMEQYSKKRDEQNAQELQAEVIEETNTNPQTPPVEE